MIACNTFFRIVKRVFLLVILLLAFLPGYPIMAGMPAPVPKRIALLTDGPSKSQEDLTHRFQKALQVLAEGEVEPDFLKTRSAHWQKEKAAALLRQALQNPSVDLIFVNGPLLGTEALRIAQKGQKPIVGLFNFDPDVLPLATPLNRLPVALVVIPGQIEKDLQTLQNIFKTRELTLLADGVLLEQFKDLKKTLLNAAKKKGFSSTVKPLQKTSKETLLSLGKPAKAVYLTPGILMPENERKELIRALNNLGCFVFSGAGAPDVQNGALAGQLPPMNERLARHAALNVMRFFSGMKSRNPLERLTPKRKLQINETTALAVKYHVTERVAETAEEITPEPPVKSVVAALPEVDRLPLDHHLKKNSTQGLTLAQAVERALKNNASLSVKEAKVEEDRQDRNRVLTELFPQIQGNAGYLRLDQNIAQRSFGTLPQERSSAGFALKQLIFSDPVITRLRAANRGVESALFEEASKRLDVAANTQERYMDCLAAAALYWIREYNLKLTEQNLKTARERKAAGTAGPQEVYRWETQAAQDKSRLMNAQSALQQSMVALNRIMGEKQHQIWRFQNLHADEIHGAFNEKTFMSLILNPDDFHSLTSHVVDTALDTSPELKSIERLIDATRILKGYFQRRFVVPEASVEFGYSHTLSQTFDNVPAVGDFLRYVPEDADNHWGVQVKLVWSLFEGGGKVVDVRKNRATLRKLASLHREASQIVEERARNALIKASAARSNMGYARVAEQAAKKNYKIVRDGYANGVATILDLLDAQKQSLVQEREAVLSEYRFQKAVIEVERSMSRIAALVPAADQEAWWKQVQTHLKKKD